MSESYACVSGGVIAAGRYVAPAWAPAAGELKTISKAAGFFGTNGGATLAEIDPNYQWWDTNPASNQPFGGPSQPWSTISTSSGAGFNSDTRQYFGYGAGGSSMNVCAPFAFDLNDLRWKWLDQPLPFDGYQSLSTWTVAAAAALYPAEQLDPYWGEVLGGWSGWPEALRRSGVLQPIPCHSRAQLLHIPAQVAGNSKGKFFKCDMPTGVTSGLADSTVSSHLFDFDTALWARAVNRPFNSSASANGRGIALDKQRGKATMFGAGQANSTSYWVLDVATETWSTRTATGSVALATDTCGTLTHDAADLYVMPAQRDGSGNPAGVGNGSTTLSNGVTYDFWVVRLADLAASSGAFSPVKLNVSVVSGWPLNPATGVHDRAGWTYCPIDKCLYCVGGWNGTSKYWKLTPPAGAVTQAEYISGTWTLTEHTFSTGTFSTSLTLVPQYNRLKWDAKSRAFIWHAGGLNDPVMAFRPYGL